MPVMMRRVPRTPRIRESGGGSLIPQTIMGDATAGGGGVGCATRMGAAIRMGSRMPMIGRMGGPGGGGGGGGVGENVVTPWARGIEAILTPRIRDAIGLGRHSCSCCCVARNAPFLIAQNAPRRKLT